MVNNIQMMERGAYIDPHDLQRRERLVEQLRAQSQHIAQPERHWTQGLARMMQGLNAGIESQQLKNEKNQYRQNRQSEMQKIAGLLNGGNPQEILSQLQIPETQALGYGMATKFETRKQDAALRRELQNEKMHGMKELAGYRQSLKPRNLQMEYSNQAYQTLAQGGQLTPAQEMALQNSRMGPNINLGEKGLTEEQKVRGKVYGEQFNESLKMAKNAEEKENQLDQVLNEMHAAKTGPGFEPRKYIATAAQFIGLDPNKLNLGDPEAMTKVNQVLNQYVLDEMKAQKGPQTDRDREFISKSKPSPTDTPEMIYSRVMDLKKTFDRTREYADSQEKWVTQYGSLGAKDASGKPFNERWNEYTRTHPLFSTSNKR